MNKLNNFKLMNGRKHEYYKDIHTTALITLITPKQLPEKNSFVILLSNPDIMKFIWLKKFNT